MLYRSQQRFRSDHHKVYTEEVNKIALSSNDDKRIQTFDKVTTYPYGTNAFMICKNEMLLKNKFIDSKSQSHRDKSQVLRKESQTLRTNSLLLRNELKEIRALSHDIKNKSYILRIESQRLRNKSNESQSLRDKSQVLRKESQALRTNSLLLRNELKEIRAASHDIKNKSYILRTKSQRLGNKSAKNEFEKELKEIREESLQKPRKSDNDNKPCDNKPYDNDKSKLQVIINVIDENKGINKNKSIKPEYKSDLRDKMSDNNNILSSKNLLQDRKIFNYMEMILKKFICEQFVCGKLCTTKSNKNITILWSLKLLTKNIKITIRKEEIFIRIENNSKKKIKRFIEIHIDNNQAILVLSYIDYRKSYISVCDNKISSCTLCNNRNLNVYTNDVMMK